MGCVASSPHSRRRHYDPADLDEVEVPLRYFGTYRNGSVQCPDDIDALPSCQMEEHLNADCDPILYEADKDHGWGFRCVRPLFIVCFSCPVYWAAVITWGGLTRSCQHCTCDQACCWVRKEYSTRYFYRVYANRIEVNEPKVRLWGLFGCGSWNADDIYAHPFDRGAFGFRRVAAGDASHLCCLWPTYGGSVARQRCQCNGSLWPRLGDCGGWWCDEWICDMWFCSYRYDGLANPEEVATASSIALQAYFEGRPITPEDMERCLEYWRDNISETGDPRGRRRAVCCEPFSIPCCTCHRFYKFTHPERKMPYDEDDERNTPELREVYEHYDALRKKQIEAYESYIGAERYSTLCRACGCKRVFGRSGLIFCTEGCCTEKHKQGEPAPPFEHRDLDDENDASVILRKVLGDPPANVVYRRWEFNEQGKIVLVTRGASSSSEQKENDVEGGLMGSESSVEGEEVELKPHDE